MGEDIDLLVNYSKAKRNVEACGLEKTNKAREIARKFGKEFFEEVNLLITGSLALGSGGSICEVSTIGSIAAAIQVGRMENTTLIAKELSKELEG